MHSIKKQIYAKKEAFCYNIKILLTQRTNEAKKKPLPPEERNNVIPVACTNTQSHKLAGLSSQEVIISVLDFFDFRVSFINRMVLVVMAGTDASNAARFR